MNHMGEVWGRILTMQKYKFPKRIETYSFSWDEKILQNDKILS
jgi:hypothetical protein